MDLYVTLTFKHLTKTVYFFALQGNFKYVILEGSNLGIFKNYHYFKKRCPVPFPANIQADQSMNALIHYARI
jgi:hypothetical protein